MVEYGAGWAEVFRINGATPIPHPHPLGLVFVWLWSWQAELGGTATITRPVLRRAFCHKVPAGHGKTSLAVQGRGGHGFVMRR